MTYFKSNEIFISVIFACLVGLVGCNSKVSTVASDTASEASKQGDPQSIVDVLQVITGNSAPTCSGQNSLRLLLTLYPAHKLKCRDATRLKVGLSPGPVCPGGPVLKAISPNSAWVDCQNLTLCGQAAGQNRLLASPVGSEMRQLDFSNLPWGCDGSIDWTEESTLDDPEQLHQLPVEFAAPPCPDCATTGIPTCELCGTDTIKPVIQNVAFEVAACNLIRVIVFAIDNESGLNRDAYSFDGGTTWVPSNEYLFKGMSLNLDKSMIRVRDRAGNVTISTQGVSLTSPPCPCMAPWGESIPSGESRKAYRTGSVTCGQTCDTQTQTRACNNGVLSGTGDYSFNKCEVVGCPSCKLPWGEVLLHGRSAVAFEQPTALCEAQCRSVVVTCDKGTLSKDLTGYPNQKCVGQQPTCGCTSPWGESFDKDAELDAYKSAKLTCAQAASCSDPGFKIKIRCVEPVGNKIAVSQGTGAIADFKEPSCTIPSCGCLHLGTILTPGNAMKVYRFAKSVPPAVCNGVGNVGEVRCKLSGTSFVKEGDTNTTTFPAVACEDPAGGGNSDSNVGPGAGGGSGGGLGNSVGEGEGFKRRSFGGGSGCDVNAPPYVCLTYNSGFAQVRGGMCFLPGPNGPKAIVPTDSLDQRIERGGFVGAFSQKTVACGDSCAKYLGVITCLPNGMSDLTKFPYSDCKEVCP